MASGPEHYRRAERILAQDWRSERDIAIAQVHASLALAAATVYSALGVIEGFDYTEDLRPRWARTTY